MVVPPGDTPGMTGANGKTYKPVSTGPAVPVGQAATAHRTGRYEHSQGDNMNTLTRSVVPPRFAAARSCFLAVAVGVVSSLIALTPALASDLVYQPRNPSFGGDPFNSSHFLGLADRQNRFDGASSSGGISRDPGDQLVRRLESRISSAIAQQAADAILGQGDDMSDSGTIEFGDQRIEFNRGVESIHLTIIDKAAGTSTEISVPKFHIE